MRSLPGRSEDGGRRRRHIFTFGSPALRTDLAAGNEHVARGRVARPANVVRCRAVRRLPERRFRAV